MSHPTGRMSFVELVRRKVEKMAWGPCLLCFHEADVALSHLMVSKKRLDTILAFSNSYGDNFRFFYFLSVFRRFYNKKDAEILTNSKKLFSFSLITVVSQWVFELVRRKVEKMAVGHRLLFWVSVRRARHHFSLFGQVFYHFL